MAKKKPRKQNAKAESDCHPERTIVIPSEARDDTILRKGTLLSYESLDQLRRRGQIPGDYDSHHDLSAVKEEAPTQISRGRGNRRH